MTTIHFHYTDSYNNPSRGSLAFMPHRRHAANETEVLPKPFTIPLLNGEATVNLQPNSSSWVWIITEYFEGVSKSFYTTVPDRDGVIEHTELVHISPSSIPAPYDAVEPAWWAEMRQYKTTVSDTLLKSGEALAQAEHAIETGKESVERTQHNASVAGAYADESRQSSYDARQYRDEAEQWRNEAQEQADRAATGPESAAARAETAATRAETSETRARGYEDDARNHAAEARSSETNATSAASTATERASDARNEANRAESEANRAKTYADELMEGPREYVDQAREARDDARDYATDSQNHADRSASYVPEVENFTTTTQGYRDEAQSTLDTIQDIYDDIQQRTETGYAVLHGHSSQEVPSESFTQVEFDSHYTQGNIFSTTPSTVTVNRDGWYSISANVRHAASSTASLRQLRLHAGADEGANTSNSGATALTISLSAVQLHEGDEISVDTYHNTGMDITMQGQGGRPNSLRVHYLGPILD